MWDFNDVSANYCLTHITGIWVEHCCNWVLLIASWFFLEPLWSLKPLNSILLSEQKICSWIMAFFLCSSFTEDQFYYSSIPVWFGDVLDNKILRSFHDIFETFLGYVSHPPPLWLSYIKAKPPEFLKLCGGVKLSMYFQGYFIMEETVLDLWPCVKDAQVLPTSIYVNSCVCPRNSSSKSAYCRLVAQNPIPAGK